MGRGPKTQNRKLQNVKTRAGFGHTQVSMRSIIWAWSQESLIWRGLQKAGRKRSDFGLWRSRPVQNDLPGRGRTYGGFLSKKETENKTGSEIVHSQTFGNLDNYNQNIYGLIKERSLIINYFLSYLKRKKFMCIGRKMWKNQMLLSDGIVL